MEVSAPLPGEGRLARWFRQIRAILIVGFVVCQLLFMVGRGALDLFYDEFTGWLKQRPWYRKVKPAFTRVESATRKYGNFLGIEQGWRLFPGPMARYDLFLAARIEFTDDTEAMIYSENEPDLKAFFRVGGWRLRKMEDYLAFNVPDDMAESDDLPTWSAYACWCLRRWQAANPEDGRVPRAICLVNRQINFPEPGSPPCSHGEVEMTTIAVFDPEGRLQ